MIAIDAAVFVVALVEKISSFVAGTYRGVLRRKGNPLI